MKAIVTVILVVALGVVCGEMRAETIAFEFDGGPLQGSMPFDQTSGGVTAHFTAAGSGYSIQRADVLGFTPTGFSGYCLYPNSIFASDLTITFSQSLKDASILYAPEEYATDSSCTMRITAYKGSNYIGTNTHVIDPPGTWPTGTLSFSSAQAFDKIVIHYDKAPVTGGDYGPIFMADHLVVNTVPEPTGGTLLVAGFVALLGCALLRKSKR